MKTLRALSTLWQTSGHCLISDAVMLPQRHWLCMDSVVSHPVHIRTMVGPLLHMR